MANKQIKYKSKTTMIGPSLVAQWLSIRLPGTSLVAQGLRIRLPVQGTRVRALVQEDPT